MKNRAVIVTFLLSFCVLLISCKSFYNENSYYSDRKNIAVVPEVGTVPTRVELDQAWSEQTRLKFWFTSQGSQIIPYNWFTWLEQTNNTEYFRSAEHMESLRYLPMESSNLNPSGLPIGFALAQNKKNGETWVGMTCAACHTNQLDYNGRKILIEGAPTLGNFVLFYSELIDALNATNQDKSKFDRFARRVLSDDYNADSAEKLRGQLLKITLRAAERQNVNKLPKSYPNDFTSYARLDAFGNIQNAGSAFALHNLNNNNAPTAPVSYPFLWGTHQSDVVQWNASAPNTPVIGPLVRNIGEVVGVFGGLSIEKAPWWQRLFGKKNRYYSTVDLIGLGHLESWVKELRSPAWPQAYLPPIDAIKAAQGASLYQRQCAACHQVIARSDEGNDYIAVKTPLTEVGTDPTTAWNIDYHMAKTLILEGTKSKILVGDEFGETAVALSIPVNGVVGLVLKDPITALEAGLIPLEAASGKNKESSVVTKSLEEYISVNLNKRNDLKKNRSPKSDPSLMEKSTKNLDGLVYKARPLNGIWATAPYLHNGSVPNLWELLQPPKSRTTRFWVGNREFDPVHVGFNTAQGLSEFKVLNLNGGIQAGNSNLGHTYGTQLTDNQKWEIIEYMKTL